MKNTIITGAFAIALAAPTFAGEEVVASKTVIEPAAPTCNLGFTGEISLGWQSDYMFRGLTGATIRHGGDGAEDSMIAELNTQYAFNDNWAAVAGATVRSGMETHNSVGHDSFRIGGLWHNDMFSAELGYQYHNVNYADNQDELYLNLGTVCPWTGANVNLFYAYSLDRDTENVLAGDYLELSASKLFAINDCFGIELSGGIAYSFDYWSSNLDNWNHYYITVGAPYKVGETLTVTPYVTFTDGLSQMYPISVGAGQVDQEDQWVFGVKAAVTF